MSDQQPAATSAALGWTGERFIPGVGGRVEVEHLHRYAFALRLAQDKDVLDMACGEGYGTHLLSGVARLAAGVDVSNEAIGHAVQTYRGANLEFRCGSCSDIPYPDQSFDLVVSFETIEHHDQHQEMMGEIKRVLRQGGCLLISSPDKLHYSTIPGHSNAFHVKELYENEFIQLLESNFSQVMIYGQKICFGSLIAPRQSAVMARGFVSAAGNARAVSNTDNLRAPSYLIALARDQSLPALSTSFWETNPTLDEVLATNASTALQGIQPFGHYRLGDVIDFRLGGNALLFQRSGWDIPTAGGSWTMGSEATLLLRMIDWKCDTTPITIEIQAQGLVDPAHPQTLMELHVNQHPVGVGAFGQLAIHDWPYALAAEDKPTKELFITFRIINPVAAKTLGLSEDQRQLGLLLTRLKITPT